MPTLQDPSGARNHLDTLNPEQREAVEHLEGPLLVLAGAGSGKTRVLTSRVVHLIREHGISPDRILAVTFTNKAAGEMRERIRSMLGGDPAGIWIGTFHSLGARLLRRHAELLGWASTFTIFDAEESLREIKRVQVGLDIDPKRWKPKALRTVLSDAKNQLVSPEEFWEDHGEGFDLFLRQAARVYPEYQSSLKAQNAFDFDDLLVKPIQLFEGHAQVLERYRSRFGFLLVDEYQDTNRAQYRFLELLGKEHGNLMVVGDDDQSIYGWRGADIRNILDFEGTFPDAKVIRLERNYRSTERILQAANEVIRQNLRRKGKTLHTDRAGGDLLTVVECLDERDEARWIVETIQGWKEGAMDGRYRGFSILYRTNAQSRALEDAFRRAGVPYQIVGGVRFYERREIQDVLAYLRIISNPLDEAAFLRVVNYPRRGVGDTSKERLVQWAQEERMTLLEGARRATEIPDLRGQSAASLERFAELIQVYSGRAARVSVGRLLEELIEELDLLTNLRDEGPDGEDRAENVKELVAGALDFDARLVEEWEGDPPDHFTELDLFLQHVALVTDVDRHDPDSDAVTLMTLHNAKGLEFPIVFIAGMEDGLFPLSRSFDEPEQLEEERRLFYVGITRAEDRLVLTHARERRRAGDFTYGSLSSFVEAVPAELRETERTPAVLRRSGPAGTGTRRLARTRASEQPDPDLDLDMELNQDLPRFTKGERVAHGTFGSGSVVDVDGFGRDLKVVVNFDSVGRKKLLARYADLTKEMGG